VQNLSPGGSPIRSVDPNLKIPESYQFNVGFERQIFKKWVFEANYTWNKTSHLWRDSNPNAPSLARANAFFGSNFSSWNAFLLDPAHNTFQLSPTRKYTFFSGLPTDTTGTHDGTQTGPTCGTSTANCFVNLNSSNIAGTLPVVAVTNQNFAATGAPIGIAKAAINQFRSDPTLQDEASRIGSRGNAFYQGLVLELRSRFRKLGGGFGSTLRIAYTLSKTMDDGLNNTADAEIDGNFQREWARTLQDRRHRIAVSGTVETPWYLGKLRFSPLFRFGTSAPFNLGAGGDRNLSDLSTDRVNFSGNLKDIKWREPGSPIPSALLGQFSLQPIGATSGNLPRNAGIGPSFFTFDLSVTREWKFGERLRFRPVLEVGNIFNAAVFSYGSAFINFAVSPADQTLFLVPTRTFRQRDMRLGARIDF
jgi:hypothetical protein